MGGAGPTGGQPVAQTISLPQINVSDLDKYEGEGLKQFVGNSIYETILNRYGEKHAPIITGTLLDENVVDFR